MAARDVPIEREMLTLGLSAGLLLISILLGAGYLVPSPEMGRAFD